MFEVIDRGALHSLTLRFLDPELEQAFQAEEGRAGVGGYRIITAATVLLWLLAGVLLPLATDLSFAISLTVCAVMALVGSIAFALSRWADTMNRQHLLAGLLTSANGLVIILLANAADSLEGYAVGGIMLLFLFGFVSRTRFVHAVARTVVIGLGLAVAVAVYDGHGSLVLDSFIYVAAGVGSLLGLRLIERNRRQLWHHRLVIEEQTDALSAEKAESERLLLNVLPASVSLRLKGGENPIADDFPSVSVVFADIVGFTPMASRLTAVAVTTLLSDLFSTFDDLVTERGLEKIKTIGDAYLAVGGLPEPVDNHAQRVIELALAMLECLGPGGRFPDLEMRIGVHSGPVAGGVIGTRKFAYDVWGDTVNIASRLEQSGTPGRIHVSQHTKDLTDGVFRFEPRGPTELRGLGIMTTYFVIEAEV